MEKFQAVLNLHHKHQSALGYSLVTLLTVGTERIFSTAVFQCPCTASWNLLYGLVFLLVPALALFLLGYVLNARTWRLLTGCCARDACKGCCAPWHWLQVCAQLSGVAAVAPLTWVAVALLGGTFYECAASGSKVMARLMCPESEPDCAAQLPLVPCNQAEAPVQDLLKNLRAHSQLLGWLLIAAIIIMVLIVTSITQCISPVSFMQLKFWKIYLEQEQKILENQARDHAAELAKENVKCFFDCSHPKELNTPTMEHWKQISSLYTFNAKKQYYSTLHKYVNENVKSQNIIASEEDTIVSALAFVDTPGMKTTTDL